MKNIILCSYIQLNAKKLKALKASSTQIDFKKIFLSRWQQSKNIPIKKAIIQLHHHKKIFIIKNNKKIQYRALFQKDKRKPILAKTSQKYIPTNENFNRFLKTLIEDMGIVKYIVNKTYDNSFNLTLTNKRGQKYKLYIQNEKTMLLIAQLAKTKAGLPQQVKDDLSEQKKMLCYEATNLRQLQCQKNWSACLFKAKSIPGTKLKFSLQMVN